MTSSDACGKERRRRLRRSRPAVAGVVGLAMTLGVGACGDGAEDEAVPQAMPAASASAGSATSAPSVESQSSLGPPVSVAPSPSKSAPSLSPSEQARVEQAREFAKKHQVTIKTPLEPPVDAAPIKDLMVSEDGDVKKDRRMIRVVSARSDLTGQRELAWVADEGEKVGSARCTKTIKLSNNAKPKKRDNLLLCWRTSEQKSVFTVMVDLDGKPSKKESVAALAKRWSAMR